MPLLVGTRRALLGSPGFNPVQNSSFERALAGTWVANGASAAITRVTDDASHGTACCEVSASTNGHGIAVSGASNLPIIRGLGTHVVSFDAKTISGGTNWKVDVEMFTAAGVSLGVATVQTFTAPPGWQRMSLVYELTLASAGRVQIYITRASSVAGVMRIDAVQLDPGSSPRPYVAT